MLRNLIVISLLAVSVGCSSSSKRKFDATRFELKNYILMPLPEWSMDSLYEGFYLDVEPLMEYEKLSRLEVVEVQNRMRDLLVSDPNISILESYKQGLKEVREGKGESGWKPVAFKEPGDYVVAIDMDETLLVQWYASYKDGNADAKEVVLDEVHGFEEDKLSAPAVKIAPGAEEFILRMKKNPHCKGVVIFSAKLDTAGLDVLSKWKFKDGKSAREHVDGVFLRNHLILETKALVPSKDLRLIDPELKHVVIVDDTPTRVMQHQNLWAHPKFDADVYKKALEGKNRDLTRHYEASFRLAGDDIEESARAAQGLKVTFAQAMLPYSYFGSRVFRSLERVTGSREKALKLTRLHPELQKAEFVFTTRKKKDPQP
jgi:hypothetical protein